MAVQRSPSDKKGAFANKLVSLVNEHSTFIIVACDHVGSKQMADIRQALRGKATVLMGKNTTIKKVLKLREADAPDGANIIPLMRRNVGLVFCQASTDVVKDVILEYKVPAPARQGVVAPVDVSIPAGPTGMDPTQTSFFQALGISTKIVKGQIEIQNQVQMVKSGEKVSASAAALLQKLNIRPFFYGLKLVTVCQDGAIYDASVLDIDDAYIRASARRGLECAAAFSMQLGLANAASVPHYITKGFKRCAALALGTDYPLKALDLLRNAKAPAPAGKAAGAAAPAKAESEKEESDEEMGLSMFD